MLLSMTGFGKSTVQVLNKKITVEIKSLNSKQMDLNTRVPSVYRGCELDLRNIVAKELQRGKSDMTVSVEVTDGEAPARLNVKALAAYKRQIMQASDELGIGLPEDWYGILLRFPDTMRTDFDEEVAADEVEALTACTKQAVDMLMQYRRAEGVKLEEFFTVRIRKIAALLEQVAEFENERVAKIRARIEDGLSKISIVEYDKGRLEQEMIFYIEKLDVNEEKQRLTQHLSYFMETLAGEPGQGKKLGFIAQEMGREINTLGSKSNQADMQRIVVMMKDELEQIKEQVLNVM